MIDRKIHYIPSTHFTSWVKNDLHHKKRQFPTDWWIAYCTDEIRRNGSRTAVIRFHVSTITNNCKLRHFDRKSSSYRSGDPKELRIHSALYHNDSSSFQVDSIFSRCLPMINQSRGRVCVRINPADHVLDRYIEKILCVEENWTLTRRSNFNND